MIIWRRNVKYISKGSKYRKTKIEFWIWYQDPNTILNLIKKLDKLNIPFNNRYIFLPPQQYIPILSNEKLICRKNKKNEMYGCFLSIMEKEIFKKLMMEDL